MKSDGNRPRIRRIALFPGVMPYKGARSTSSSTFSPQITRMICAICWIGTACLLIRGDSSKQPCHLYHGGVENVEEELGRDADGEHEKRDRNYDPLLVRSEIGKSDTGFDERTAEERLHRAHEDDGGEEETEHGRRGE